MTKEEREVMQMALGFVASISPAFICEATHHKKNEEHASNEPCPHVKKQKQTYEDIKQALAQPEQEPVGWAEHGVINWLADKQFNHTSFLYDTPAQRTWVDLTDGEIEAAIPYKNLSGEYYYDDVLNIVLLIQAKLKRKNI